MMPSDYELLRRTHRARGKDQHALLRLPTGSTRGHRSRATCRSRGDRSRRHLGGSSGVRKGRFSATDPPPSGASHSHQARSVPSCRPGWARGRCSRPHRPRPLGSYLRRLSLRRQRVRDPPIALPEELVVLDLDESPPTPGRLEAQDPTGSVHVLASGRISSYGLRNVRARAAAHMDEDPESARGVASSVDAGPSGTPGSSIREHPSRSTPAATRALPASMQGEPAPR